MSHHVTITGPPEKVGKSGGYPPLFNLAYAQKRSKQYYSALPREGKSVKKNHKSFTSIKIEF